MANQFGIKIRQLREEGKLLQKQVADPLHMDPPMLSKIEKGDRRAKKAQVELFAKVLGADPKELLTLWLADHLLNVVDGEELGLRAIILASEYVSDHLKEQINFANGL